MANIKVFQKVKLQGHKVNNYGTKWKALSHMKCESPIS